MVARLMRFIPAPSLVSMGAGRPRRSEHLSIQRRVSVGEWDYGDNFATHMALLIRLMWAVLA